MVSKKIKNILFLILRILFSFLILFFIFKKLNLKYFFEGLSKINICFLILPFLFYWLTLFLLSARWKILLLPFLSKNVSLFEIFKVYMLGMLINTVTPATMGVDISRGIILSEHSSGKSKGFASVLVDRIAGMLGIFFLALFCTLIQYRKFSDKNLIGYFSFLLILIFLLLVLLFSPPFKKLMEIIKKVKTFGLGEKLYDFHNAIYSYKKNINLLLYAFFLSILLQITFSFQAFFVGISFGVYQNPIIFLSFVPIINALNFLPITISGLGLREAGFFILFKNYISKENAILISLFYWLVSATGNLPALYYLFKTPLKRREK